MPSDDDEDLSLPEPMHETAEYSLRSDTSRRDSSSQRQYKESSEGRRDMHYRARQKHSSENQKPMSDRPSSQFSNAYKIRVLLRFANELKEDDDQYNDEDEKEEGGGERFIDSSPSIETPRRAEKSRRQAVARPIEGKEKRYTNRTATSHAREGSQRRPLPSQLKEREENVIDDDDDERRFVQQQQRPSIKRTADRGDDDTRRRRGSNVKRRKIRGKVGTRKGDDDWFREVSLDAPMFVKPGLDESQMEDLAQRVYEGMRGMRVPSKLILVKTAVNTGSKVEQVYVGYIAKGKTRLLVTRASIDGLLLSYQLPMKPHDIDELTQLKKQFIENEKRRQPHSRVVGR